VERKKTTETPNLRIGLPLIGIAVIKLLQRSSWSLEQSCGRIATGSDAEEFAEAARKVALVGKPRASRSLSNSTSFSQKLTAAF